MVTEMADVAPSAAIFSDVGLAAMVDSVGVVVVLSFFEQEVKMPIDITQRMKKIRLIYLIL
jgi:hypothetical protein